MDLIDLKDRISRLRFFFEKIKNSRTKNFYFSIIGLIVVVTAIFLAIYFNQSLEIKRKENILKSYYSQEETSGSMEGQAQVKESGENIKGGAFTAVSQDNIEDIDNTEEQK